jgi:hypothetical protein
VPQTQEGNDLRLVEAFFAARGLKAEQIPETTTKTTDFKILRGGDVIALCEVKSPQDVFVERVENAIHKVPPGQIGGIIEHGASSRQYRCMERAATKAAEQFNAVNPSRNVPNILMVVNHDTVSYESDFVEAVTGYVEGLGYGPKSLRASIPEIDAYVWLDPSAPPPRMLWQQNQFRDTIIDLLKPN